MQQASNKRSMRKENVGKNGCMPRRTIASQFHGGAVSQPALCHSGGSGQSPFRRVAFYKKQSLTATVSFRSLD